MKNLIKTLNILYDNIYYAIHGGVAAARRKGVTVGNNCRIYIKNFGTEPFLISVGSRTTITSGVRILTHDGSTCLIKNAAGSRYQRYEPVIIGDDVFIGVNSIIMPGVKIGSRVIVGAGSVVTRDIEDGTIVAGNPARIIGEFDSYYTKISMTCPNNEDLIDVADYIERVKCAVQMYKG